MQRFYCQTCDHEVHFDNVACVACDSALGYAPQVNAMLAAAPGEVWRDKGGATYSACQNRDFATCNWLVDGDGGLCRACRHNRVIPNLDDPTHLALWRAIEAAKRRLFYSLIRWHLPAPTKAEDEAAGLAFDFLADEVGPDGMAKQHLTGHASGLITINIAEGDDAERERRRSEMGEPYRTLVGHFRHEIGHYYWDRLVAHGPALTKCREVFGDDTEDYAAALQRHYQNGPPDDWADHAISAYATAHPWEDFAETFSHYVHMVDGLETAHAFGVVMTGAMAASDPYEAGSAEDLIAAWVPVTVAVNAVNRSMGQPDLYPFVLSPAVAQKLGFIHALIRGEAV